MCEGEGSSKVWLNLSLRSLCPCAGLYRPIYITTLFCRVTYWADWLIIWDLGTQECQPPTLRSKDWGRSAKFHKGTPILLSILAISLWLINGTQHVCVPYTFITTLRIGENLENLTSVMFFLKWQSSQLLGMHAIVFASNVLLTYLFET